MSIRGLPSRRLANLPLHPGTSPLTTPLRRLARLLTHFVLPFASATVLAGCVGVVPAPAALPGTTTVLSSHATTPLTARTGTGTNEDTPHDIGPGDAKAHAAPKVTDAAKAPADAIGTLLVALSSEPSLTLGASVESLRRDVAGHASADSQFFAASDTRATRMPRQTTAPGRGTPALDAADPIAFDDAPVRPTPTQGDVWARIRVGFAMPVFHSPLVEQRVRWYLARPDLLTQMLERGAPYLFFILEELEARGMPTELALLPFVESAMNPIALSHASASGLWQFIPATGRRFELSQDWWVDERRDIVASTRAALEYLQEVHDMHGDDWFLALASYNWGENAVARAVRSNLARGRPAGYGDLRMPQETRHYVPKLLALKRIVQQAAELGIVLPSIPDVPYFTTLRHTRPLDMKLAAQFAGMTLDDFTLLNPAHNRPVIATHRHDEIKLPVGRVAAFRRAAAHHESQRKPFVTWRPHTLARSDDLATIAARHDMTPADILRVNGLPAKSTPRPGSRVLVPTRQAGDPTVLEAFDRPNVVALDARPRAHRAAARRGARAASMMPPRTASARKTTLRGASGGPKAGGPKAGRPQAKPTLRPATVTRISTRAPSAQTRRAAGGMRGGARR